MVAEKGGLIILELINLIRDNKDSIKFHITGNGDLAIKFEKLSKSNPKLIKYYGVVDDKNLIKLLANGHSFESSLQ